MASQRDFQENYDCESEVGFIGLGHLGGRMAARLVKARNQLVVFDAESAAVDSILGEGAQPAGSAREVVERCVWFQRWRLTSSGRLTNGPFLARSRSALGRAGRF